MDLELGGKVALVTGASRGIGRAIAEELGEEGAKVSLCARGKDELDDVAQRLARRGIEVLATPADVTVPGDVAAVVDTTHARFGRVDILINNAGAAVLGRSWDATDAEWAATLDVNLGATVRCTRAVVPLMRRQGGGRIVNIASVSGHVMIGGLADYQAAKAAVLAYTKSMAIDLAPDNILVNAVCPALIHTPLWEQAADELVGIAGDTRDDVFANLAGQHLLIKRFGRVDEVSGLVAFLASDRASFITGVAYDVDGGCNRAIP